MLGISNLFLHSAYADYVPRDILVLQKDGFVQHCVRCRAFIKVTRMDVYPIPNECVVVCLGGVELSCSRYFRFSYSQNHTQEHDKNEAYVILYYL